MLWVDYLDYFFFCKLEGEFNIYLVRIALRGILLIILEKSGKNEETSLISIENNLTLFNMLQEEV